jgi:hypothetical protein
VVIGFVSHGEDNVVANADGTGVTTAGNAVGRTRRTRTIDLDPRSSIG